MLNRKCEYGASLVEALIAVAIVGFVVLLLASLPNAINLVQKSKYLALAREIAVKNLEDTRQLKYDNLVNGEQDITDSRISLLPRGSGKTAVEDCSVSICTNSEDVKQVTVTISWSQRNNPQQVALKTFISKGGLDQ